MIGVNLANMSDKDGYTLDEVFPGKTPGLVAYRAQGEADYVQIWENANSKYGDDLYYLWVSRKADNPEADYTWRVDADTPANFKLKSGDAIWYFHRGDQTVTVQCSGEVEFTASGAEVTVYPGWNMINAPYAAGLNFNANSQEYWKTSGAAAYRAQGEADYVQIWENENGKYGDTLYYLWVSRKADNPEADYTWRADADTPAPDNLANMGCGLWYFHRGDTPITLKLTPPYSL